MKKGMLIVALALACSAGYAQKTKVSTAENSLLLQQYDAAKTNIDEALENEKTSSWTKTYIVAGRVYGCLAANGKDDEGAVKGRSYFEKAIELDQIPDEKGKGVGKFDKDIKDELNKYSNDCANFGANCFNTKNYSAAQTAFINAIWAHSMQDGYAAVNDSVLLYNVAIAAMLGEDYKTAAEYFKQTFEVDYEGPMSILRANYCLEQINDTEGQEANLKAGFEKYPENKDILTTLIQYYLTAGKNEEALVYLNEAIEKDPSVAVFYYARGCLNEKIDRSAAIADYETAISKDPKHFNSLYNLGVVYYNWGVEIQNEASGERDQAKYDALMADQNEKFKLSIPYMERANEIALDNGGVDSKRATLDALKSLYYRTGDYDKSSQMAEELKAL